MVDDDIRKKYDLRTTEGKKAAEEDRAERLARMGNRKGGGI